MMGDGKKALEMDSPSLDLDPKPRDQDAEQPPPSYEEVVEDPPKYKIEPATLVLDGESIYSESSPSTPLYRLSRRITVVVQKSSSIKFERVEQRATPDKPDSTTAAPVERRHHLFYLVHPPNARYRTDVHPYFMTSRKPGMLGNVRLETAKSRLQKTEFRALLSPRRSAVDDPLFDENDGDNVLFSAKVKWMGGRCNWTDAGGRGLAFEDGRSHKPRLVITTAMEADMRDALVAVWCLKVWHDNAETSAAKRDGEFALGAPAGSATMLVR